MKIKLLDLLAFLGAELLTVCLGMLSIETCSPEPARPHAKVAAPASTPVATASVNTVEQNSGLYLVERLRPSHTVVPHNSAAEEMIAA